MSKTPRHADQDLLFQVLGTVSLLLLAFVETALGLFPFLYGSAPYLIMMVMVCLALHLPVAVPAIAVVLAGLLFDLLQGAPVGFTSSQLLLAIMIVMARRPLLIHADAGTVWYEFALMLGVLQIYGYAVISIWSGSLPSVGVFVFQLALTVLIFPVINWATTPLKHFAQPEHSV